MKNLIKAVLFVLAMTASCAVLADPPPSSPPPSNPVAGSSYTDTRIECFANLCEIQTFYYQYTVINGVGFWQIVHLDMKIIPRRPNLQ